MNKFGIAGLQLLSVPVEWVRRNATSVPSTTNITNRFPSAECEFNHSMNKLYVLYFSPRCFGVSTIATTIITTTITTTTTIYPF